MADVKKKHLSSEELKANLADRAERAGIDSQKLAELTILAEIMKAPTALEQREIDREREYKMQTLADNAKNEHNKRANQARYQMQCTHRNSETNKMAISGQVIGPTGDEVSFVQCNDPYCKKTWMWKAMPDEVKQGLSLNDGTNRRFQNAEQLDYQEKALPIDPAFARKVGYREVAARHEKYQKVTA